MRGRGRAVRSLAVALLAGGCAAIARPAPVTVPALQAEGPAISAANGAVRDSVLARLVQRAAVRGDGLLDVLLLSGGGQHGAFGVGFLRGWATRDVDPMPRFDLVSGISTGALQAPFALLGTPAALDSMADLYHAGDRFAPRVDWWFWLRRTGGLVNTSRYEARLRATFSPSLRELLRTEFDTGRQFVTATTDLDLGIGRLWDVAALLGEDDAALRRTHAVLYAATAIPGAFPPRLIDGHVHNDGGVVANLLPILDLEDYRELARRLRARGVAAPVRVRLWVIMNLWTHAPPRVVRPDRRGDIRTRSTEVVFWAAQPLALRRLEELARAVSADVPGLTLDVRIAAPPNALSVEPAADKLFDRDWMRRLEAIGHAQARSATPWDTTWSAYVRPPVP